jgi:hypothetical protein
MNPEIKRYLAAIGRRGGLATSKEKASAVRKNGAKGGRPRKDGLPPGCKPLEEVLSWLNGAAFAESQKGDWIRYVNQHAFYRKHQRGSPVLGFVPREVVVELKEVLSRYPSVKVG